MSHHDTACMWNLMKGYNLTYMQNRNGVTDVKNKLWSSRNKGGINWETGFDIYLLLCIKYAISKEPLYNTGNHT